jgi:hypothetical protein
VITVQVHQFLVRIGEDSVPAQQNWSSELRVQDRNKLRIFCDVKNRRQAYDPINAETAIIIKLLLLTMQRGSDYCNFLHHFVCYYNEKKFFCITVPVITPSIMNGSA